MTVEPGFGGQKFSTATRRVAWCDEITRRNFKTKIQVDGGVASEDRAWS